jgi:hypothetical protein
MCCNKKKPTLAGALSFQKGDMLKNTICHKGHIEDQVLWGRLKLT